jgi:purine-cytosine permease-like protein
MYVEEIIMFTVFIVCAICIVVLLIIAKFFLNMRQKYKEAIENSEKYAEKKIGKAIDKAMKNIEDEMLIRLEMNMSK